VRGTLKREIKQIKIFGKGLLTPLTGTFYGFLSHPMLCVRFSYSCLHKVIPFSEPFCSDIWVPGEVMTNWNTMEICQTVHTFSFLVLLQSLAIVYIFLMTLHLSNCRFKWRYVNCSGTF
jgi:hypothetical protein